MRFSIDRQQWEHTVEEEKLHGLSVTRDADMPVSLRKLLADFREDVEKQEARVARLTTENSRLRETLEEEKRTSATWETILNGEREHRDRLSSALRIAREALERIAVQEWEVDGRGKHPPADADEALAAISKEVSP